MTYGRQPQIDKDIDWVIDEEGNVLGYMRDPRSMARIVTVDPDTGLITDPVQRDAVNEVAKTAGKKWSLDSVNMAVVTDAPTMSASTTATVTGGTTIQYTSSLLTYFNGTMGDYIGVGYKNVTQSGASDKDKCVGVQFYVDTDVLELKLQSFGGSSGVDIFVNGQPFAETAYTWTTAGGTYYVKLSFGTVKPRLIEVNADCVFCSINIPAYATLWKAPRAAERTLAIVADSWVGGANAGGIAHSWIYRAARLMGFTQVLNFAQPGTGLVNTGGGGARGAYIDRIPQVLAKKPDKVLVCGSVNDMSGSTSLIQPAAAALTAALDAGGIDYLICGPQYCNPSNTANDDVYTSAMVAGLSSKAAATYFSPKGWLTGASNAAGNRALYAVGDNLHINALGMRFWSRQMAAACIAKGFYAS